MPKMSIDGREYEFTPGQTVLQLAHQHGISVPYFCYHPGLSIAGNCRMCLVEVEGQKKPDIACNMACREGLKVLTQTPTVQGLQKGVMEFLLLNHPLDCPTCDQAGECWLQEYYMDYARHPSLLRDHKTEKPRKAVPIGPQVMFDAERCILCTRCIRFLDEVTHTSELTIVERGGHAEISLFPAKRLENLYSANVADICPVGALTYREYRFSQRVWFLKSANTVCTACGNGCNLHVDVNQVEREAYRVRPRPNMEVNEYWMCDLGRGVHRPTNAPTRVKTPLLGKEPVSWTKAAAHLAEAIKALPGGLSSVAVVASPFLPNEDLWAVKRFAAETLSGAPMAREVSPQAPSTAKGDDFLLKADRTPNRTGLAAIVDPALPFEKIREGIEAGRISALLVLENDLVRLSQSPDKTRELLAKLPLLVALVANQNAVSEMAHLTLPLATFLERDFTFTNVEGRVQRGWPAFAPLHESRPGWAVLDYLASVMGKAFGWRSAEEVFAELAARVPAFQGLDYRTIGDQGAFHAAASPPPERKHRAAHPLGAV